MAGFGTIINVLAVLAGGFIGLLFGKFLKEKYQAALIKAIGLCVLFIGIGGVMEKMLTAYEGTLSAGGTMMLICSMTIGALLGEWIDLDGKTERFGAWLKQKSGSQKENTFVEGFVTTSFTVCIGAIEDGIYGDYSILAAKSVLDFIMLIIMTASFGKGCIFSVIPVIILQGGFTLIARLIQPLLTTPALANLSLVGSVLIFCVGLNLLFPKTIKVANLLPALVFAVICAYLPVF